MDIRLKLNLVFFHEFDFAVLNISSLKTLFVYPFLVKRLQFLIFHILL